VPNVREENRFVRQQLEDLHCERAIHIRLGRGHDGFMRPIPVVGIVEESLCHVYGNEMIGEVAREPWFRQNPAGGIAMISR